MDYLDLLQKINDILYKICGLTDKTLELQVYINIKRNEMDIPDKREIIEKDNSGEFVQWATYNHTNLQAD